MCGIWERVDMHFQVKKYLPENQVGREYCTSKVTNCEKKRQLLSIHFIVILKEYIRTLRPTEAVV